MQVLAFLPGHLASPLRGHGAFLITAMRVANGLASDGGAMRRRGIGDYCVYDKSGVCIAPDIHFDNAADIRLGTILPG